MAISVLSGSPQAATPVYNKMLFKVSGSLTSGTNYRYVCDVKNAAGTTTLARLKCDKLPTTNFGFFDVSRVVETLIAPTKPTLAQVGFADHAGFYSGYRLTFMEEYGSTPVVQTGTTTNVTGNVAFAGNLEQLELADWSGATYFPSGTLIASKALTTPTQFSWYNINDTKYLAQGSQSSAANFRKAFINYYSSNSILLRSYSVGIGNLSGSNIVRFGAGPANISALTSSQTSDSQNGSVSFSTDIGSYYTIQFGDTNWGDYNDRCDADNADPLESAANVCLELRYISLYDEPNPLGQVYTYIRGECERFNSIPVHFVNKYGGIDSYTFTMKNRKRANIQREVFGYNSDVYATTTYNKVWAGSFDYVYALNSDWLTDAESEWLIEMVRSGQVWLELNGSLVEAVVNANQYQFVTRRNDRLTQLQLEVAVAYDNNIL